jgi:hypothetical protein
MLPQTVATRQIFLVPMVEERKLVAWYTKMAFTSTENRAIANSTAAANARWYQWFIAH